ncbi:MAG TPA: aminotransferase class V-fold PLP-dependent enzyme [Bacteroidales bacterium]|jgi:selenocysteine lyase/cysteine desulfurase|nr:selenocysteine lyase [Bacteroidota bacterium]HJN06101.1 aminotransferase class V-fold PLP-dependent enzyme [Bacteroidales bacterium]
MNKLEKHFSKFKQNTIGDQLEFETPFGIKKMIYADWIASGRLYRPIEDKMTNIIGCNVGNTHTESTETGTLMTNAYHAAQKIIKDHVGADENDVIITAGPGMTAVINKLQRILGLRNCTHISEDKKYTPKDERTVIFITHMEHHSNHTSWIETNAKVVILDPDDENLVNKDELIKQLEIHKDYDLKIGSFIGGSNVTGVIPPIYEMAEIMHTYGGVAMVDFAGSAPYIDINMHPVNPLQCLDAIFFSPHKFLGGPGSSGVMIFNSNLYKIEVPDKPGGGTVEWTDPWGGHKYFDDIELREDGGTPGFLQAIRAALAIKLKDQMNTGLIAQRKEELIEIAFEGLTKVKGIHILAENVKKRLGIMTFWFEHIHYNLIVKLLNDRYGVQVRGGCACAGTYSHFLLNLSPEESQRIFERIKNGDLSIKPGFVRISLHPTMTNKELEYIISGVNDIVDNHEEWGNNYDYDQHTNEFTHKNVLPNIHQKIDEWFKI